MNLIPFYFELQNNRNTGQKDKKRDEIVKEIARKLHATLSMPALVLLKYVIAFAWQYRKEFKKQKTATGLKSLIYPELLWLFYNPHADVLRIGSNESKVRVMLAYFVVNSKELFAVDGATNLALLLWETNRCWNLNVYSYSLYLVQKL